MSAPFTPLRSVSKRTSPRKYPKPPRTLPGGKINWDAVMEFILEVVADNMHAKPAEIQAKLGWAKDDVTTSFHTKVQEAKSMIEKKLRNANGGSPLPRNEAFFQGVHYTHSSLLFMVPLLNVFSISC